jgi:RHS repeat-associated protein
LVDGTSGSLEASYEYSPFGEALRSSGLQATANPFRFSTKYYDSETDLHCFGYRYYSTSLGRFISRDPLNEPGRSMLTAPLSGGDIVIWSYVGKMGGTPGQSRDLTPDTSLAKTGLSYSTDSQAGRFRNSTMPGNVVGTQKSNGGGRGGYATSLMTPYIGPSTDGGSHPYGYVGNTPFDSIDPFGLWSFSEAWDSFKDSASSAFGWFSDRILPNSFSSFLDGGASDTSRTQLSLQRSDSLLNWHDDDFDRDIDYGQAHGASDVAKGLIELSPVGLFNDGQRAFTGEDPYHPGDSISNGDRISASASFAARVGSIFASIRNAFGIAKETAALEPYVGPGGGHHVPAKSGFIGAPGYDINAALAIPNAELARLGVNHSIVSGTQQILYRAFAQTGHTLTWNTMQTIETQALIQGGMNPNMAAGTVQGAIQSLINAGVTGPTRIPWGGK